MILDLEPVFNNEGFSLPFDYELDLSGESLSGEKPFTSPVRVKGAFKNLTGIVSVDASACFTLATQCDRCASPISPVFSIPVNHVLVTNLNDEENDELLLIEDMMFDMDVLATEDIFLNLPSKFLCKEDCKGICPTCGKDLNPGPCSCTKPIDPRLEVLKQLLDK